MTEQEKKLIELLDQYYGRHDSKPIVKALLEAFPQITKKPLPIKVIGHQFPSNKIIFARMMEPSSIEDGEMCFLIKEFEDFKNAYYVEVINAYFLLVSGL